MHQAKPLWPLDLIHKNSHFFFYFLFTPVKRCGSLDITDFGWVVSWLDEQTQTWLPLCESSLLTSDQDPVWGVSTCVQLCVWNRKSGPAIKQQSVLLSTPTPLRCFICLDIYAFIKHYLAIGREIHRLLCLVVNDKLNQCRPIVRKLFWYQLAAEYYFANEWKWPCLVMFCTYIFLTVINW